MFNNSKNECVKSKIGGESKNIRSYDPEALDTNLRLVVSG